MGTQGTFMEGGSPIEIYYSRGVKPRPLHIDHAHSGGARRDHALLAKPRPLAPHLPSGGLGQSAAARDGRGSPLLVGLETPRCHWLRGRRGGGARRGARRRAPERRARESGVR